MSGKVKEKGKRRPGRPPGSKNKQKPTLDEYDELMEQRTRKPTARANGVRRINRPRSPRASFLQPNAKHLRLIQYWSKETKIGMQQIFDDFMNAGAVAAPKIYKGLINSRKAIEDLFDAETNTEVVGDKPRTETENNGSPDSVMSGPVVRRGDDEEQLSLAPVGPGLLEEVGTDLGEPARVEGMMQGIIDAPPTTETEEEQVEEDDENEPPY